MFTTSIMYFMIVVVFSVFAVQVQAGAKESLLPSRTVCGFQEPDNHYVPETNTVALSEFPWLAGIQFTEKSTGTKENRCGGSLISDRYVLTAANCVTVPNIVPAGVRLGEYHVHNETDCIEGAQGSECSDPPQDFGIEKMIPHPNYNKKDHDNNIALIRLDRTVTYSEYIRPICLPLPGTTANVGDILTSSGWGVTEAGGDRTEIKKKSLGKLISNEECASELGKFSHITLTENHFCTVPLNNSAPQCQGDGGGPVTLADKTQWTQIGVISHGATCGRGFPDIQMKVANYLDWITENIEE